MRPPPTHQRIMESQPLYQPAGEPELHRALLQTTWESLPFVASRLGILCFLYTFFLFTWPWNRGRLQLIGVIAGLSTLALLGIYAAYQRNLLSQPWTRLLFAAIGALVLVNGLLPHFLIRQPEYTLILILAILSAGYFFPFPRGLTGFFSIILAGWVLGLFVVIFPRGANATTWSFYLTGLMASYLVAHEIQRSRIHTYRQLEGLRLQNLQRKAEMQRVLRVTDEAQRSLATSIAVGQRIVSILDMDALLDQVTSLIQARFRCYYVGIYLVDETDENYVTARAGAGEAGHKLAGQGLRLRSTENESGAPEGIIGWVAAHRRPACVADTRQDEHYIPHPLLPDTRSELALPLEMGNQLLGVLDMESTRLNAFQEKDVPFLQLLADQAASALHNARLYQQVNRFNQDLEELVQQRTEALERMDRAKSDFISVTSHELRTPLTLLRGYGQMLADETVIQGSEPLHTMVHGILAGADRLHVIVDNMLDVAKIDNQVLELNPTTFSLKALLRLVWDESLKDGLAERRLTMEDDLQDLPQIEADLDAVHKLFSQLVSNAIKYTPDGGQIILSGQPHEPGEFLAEACAEVVISDTGVGIDPQQKDLIFTKFYRTGSIATYSSSKTRFKGGGPGLGLSIAKGIVEAHGGLIWAESSGYDEENCPGSQFHVILPLRHS